MFPRLVVTIGARTGQGQVFDVQRFKIGRRLVRSWIFVPKAVLDAPVEGLRKRLRGDLSLKGGKARPGFPEQMFDQPSVTLEERVAIHGLLRGQRNLSRTAGSPLVYRRNIAGEWLDHLLPPKGLGVGGWPVPSS